MAIVGAEDSKVHGVAALPNKMQSRVEEKLSRAIVAGCLTQKLRFLTGRRDRIAFTICLALEMSAGTDGFTIREDLFSTVSQREQVLETSGRIQQP